MTSDRTSHERRAEFGAVVGWHRGCLVAAGFARLLGPADPELTCEQCFEELDRYVELELAGRDADATVPGMRPHLEGCPACREDHDSLAALLAAESETPGA